MRISRLHKARRGRCPYLTKYFLLYYDWEEHPIYISILYSLLSIIYHLFSILYSLLSTLYYLSSILYHLSSNLLLLLFPLARAANRLATLLDNAREYLDVMPRCRHKRVEAAPLHR